MQNLASIQPRTSIVKFARSPRTDPSGPAAGDSGAGVGFDVDVEQDQADFLVAKIRDHGSDLGSDEAWDSEDERQKDLFAKANWAANKRFEISKFKFKFPRALTYELIRARSRLAGSQILQVNARWKALAAIYTMHSFAPFSRDPSG